MKRPRIGVRLMLLVVALFAVLFAWVGTQRELQQLEIQAELDDLRHYRKYFVISRQHFTSEEAWHASMKQVEAEIAKKKLELGEVAR